MKEKRFRIRLDGPSLEAAADVRITSGDLLLFIHGLGCAKESFRDVWQQKSFEDLSILAPDLVGFGESEKPESFSYSMEDQARVCEAMLDHFPDRPLHIIVHSMGGAVGLLLPKERLEQAASFVNIEGNLVPEDCGLVSRKTVSVSYAEFERDYFPFFKTQFRTQAREKIFLDRTTPQAFYRSSESLVAWSDSGKLLKQFESLQCKKIYFHGDESLNPAVVEKLKGIPIEAIKKSGHFVMNDNPDEFYARLFRFLPL
jgi:pimeloyl-ACP methyl ester carboxylesterase